MSNNAFSTKDNSLDFANIEVFAFQHDANRVSPIGAPWSFYNRGSSTYTEYLATRTIHWEHSGGTVPRTRGFYRPIPNPTGVWQFDYKISCLTNLFGRIPPDESTTIYGIGGIVDDIGQVAGFGYLPSVDDGSTSLNGKFGSIFIPGTTVNPAITPTGTNYWAVQSGAIDLRNYYQRIESDGVNLIYSISDDGNVYQLIDVIAIPLADMIGYGFFTVLPAGVQGTNAVITVISSDFRDI